MNKKFSKYFLLVFTLFFSIVANAQDVKGVVSDTSGGLPGVSIIIKGTSKGTETDFNGNYELKNVKSNDILVFSFLGYKSSYVTVNGKSVINIQLEEDSNTLDEVVVVGYGTKKKSLVTGAISSISSADIKSVSNQRVEQVLQGRTSGVTVSSSSGSPGAGAKIRIRGTGSSGNAEPLFIVDGMKVSTIDNIAPSDIANMEVLKDAASAAIYGTEGANGVIIITTKKGKEGKLKFSFNTQIGLQFVNTPMELMNASQFVTYMNEAGYQSLGNDVTDNGIDTNWIDEVFDTAFMQRYDFSLSGGTEKTSYYFSAGHTNQDGTVGNNSSFDRTSFRFNLTSEITDWLEVGINSNTAIIRRKGITENSDTRGVIQNALILDPLTALIYGNESEVPDDIVNQVDTDGVSIPLLRDEDGNVYGYPAYSDGEVINPVAYANGGIDDASYENDQFLTTAYLKFKILEGLSFTSRFGYELNQYYTKNTQNAYYVSGIANNSGYSFNDSKVRSTKWLWENFASYDKSVGNHNFKLLAGYSAEQTRIPTLSSRNGVTSISNFESFDSLDAFDITENQDNFDEYRDNLVSMYGRLSYDYKEKYLFEASIRRDVSDKFYGDFKSAVFPAFSAGWVVSKEDFWSDDAAINSLKLRGSWGQNGSKANLPGNSYLTAVTNIGEGYNNQTIIYEGYTGAQISGFGNEALVWETSEQVGVGVDLKAFNNKFNFSADYYEKATRDLLVADGSLITPGSAGFNFEAFNGGTIINKGFEFEVGYADSFENGFSYGINLNLSTLDNEVTEIAFVPEGTSIEGASAPQNDDGITRFTEGLPAWYFYGFETDGIDAATGQIIYTATGTTDTPTNDQKTMIGTPHANIMYGGNIKLGYKAFDLNVQFQGTSGNDIVATYHQPSRTLTNKPVHFFTDRWTGAGDTSATMPGAGNELAAYQTDLVVEDGSYMRVKQIQLGYTLPTSVTEKWHIDNLRVYVSLDDYFTFTNYKGLDPEIGNFGFNDIGVDRGFYPTPARSLFGFSLNF